MYERTLGHGLVLAGGPGDSGARGDVPFVGRGGLEAGRLSVARTYNLMGGAPW